MPTIQISVMGYASKPMLMTLPSRNTFGCIMKWITTPCRIAISAATSCANSFTQAFREIISSRMPVATIRISPSRMPRTSCVISTKSRTDKRNPRKIARPPMRGMGWSCTLRASRGTSIAPTFVANAFTIGVVPMLIANATMITATSFIHG